MNKTENKKIYSEFLVIGSGVGGLFASLKLSEIGKVNLITKDFINVSNSIYAQGGIAAVTDRDDSFRDHIEDTLRTGCGLSRKNIVEAVVRDAPTIIKELINFGVEFDRSGGEFELGLEGGHSHRRILHHYDYTGRAIVEALIKRIKTNKNIKIFEQHQIIDLILSSHPKDTRPEKNSVLGAYVLDLKTNRINSFISSKTILATGGGGRTYLYTSNPQTATGDGYAIAYKSGLDLTNMEFIQFHPTCLYHPKAQNFLISEALRGEGAVLKLKNGKEFMQKYSPKKELAPRDVVSRAIANELKKTGDNYVYLDISFKPQNYVKKRFPYIYKTCLDYQIDITKQPIPVVPAAHFFCGGIDVDEHGRTKMKNLYAIGEVSHTGLHGANRLASNSLLEAAVFANRAYLSIKDDRTEISKYSDKKHTLWNYLKTVQSREDVIILQNWNEIRTLANNYAGIVRSDERLLRAKKKIDLITEEINYYYTKYRPNKNFIELRNIAVVLKIIIESSLQRKESRGAYYNEDHTQQNKIVKDTVLNRYNQI
ncbi:MAG: L-aspartate oxidase [Elusimicrobia bacterium]|nr:L-aspartate oxidase [Elusimicrobiota bacterium]